MWAAPAGPDAGHVASFVAPMDDGDRGVHPPVSILPTDMRSLHHSRPGVLQQITSLSCCLRSRDPPAPAHGGRSSRPACRATPAHRRRRACLRR